MWNCTHRYAQNRKLYIVFNPPFLWYGTQYIVELRKIIHICTDNNNTGYYLKKIKIHPPVIRKKK